MTELTGSKPVVREGVLGLEITERCNFACVHCYLERKVRPKVTTELASQIAAVAGDYGFSVIYITGGEPLLHPDFEAIYEVIRSAGYITNIFSNGALFKESTFELFSRLAPHDVEITLYGATEETYQRTVQRKGQFAKVVANIRRLRAMGVPVYLKYHLLTTTRDDVYAFVDLANELGCEWSINAQIMPMLNGDQTPTKYRIPPIEARQLTEAAGQRVTARPGEGFDGYCDAGDDLFIDSQGRVRGCPILFTGGEVSVFDGVASSLETVRQFFDGYHARREHPLCPAWNRLEGPKAVEDYAEGLWNLPIVEILDSARANRR